MSHFDFGRELNQNKTPAPGEKIQAAQRSSSAQVHCQCSKAGDGTDRGEMEDDENSL